MMENKENMNNAATQTQTATEVPINGTENKTGYEGDLKDLMGEGKYNLSAPLFLMFAEYLGYVGKTLEWVDDWCVLCKKPEPYKVKFIEVEAVTVLKEAKKKYTEKKLRELYDSLYDVILFVYDDNLKSIEEKKKAVVDDI